MQKLKCLQCFSGRPAFRRTASEIVKSLLQFVALTRRNWLGIECWFLVLNLFSPFSPEWWAAGKTALTASTPPRGLETKLHKTTLLFRPALGLCTAVHNRQSEPSPSQTFTTATTRKSKKGLRAKAGEIRHPFIDTAAGSKSNKENAKFCTQIIFYTKVCRLNVSLLSFRESM